MRKIDLVIFLTRKATTYANQTGISLRNFDTSNDADVTLALEITTMSGSSVDVFKRRLAAAQ